MVLELLGTTGGASSASLAPRSFSAQTYGIYSSLSLPPTSTLTPEPGGWLAGLNIPPWQVNGHPVLFFEGATWCPYCAASSWVIYKALSSLGGVSNASFAYSTEDSIPEVVLAGLVAEGESVASMVSEDTSGVVGTFPTISDPTAQAYVTAYSGGGIPFVVVNGQFIHPATLVDPSSLSAYSTTTVEQSVLSESGAPWNATATAVYDILAFVVASLHVTVTSLATEYGWSSTLTSGVQAAFTSLILAVYPVTFSETGLPSGTSWSATLGRTTTSSTAPTMVFTEANGSYPFTVGLVPGYSMSPLSGTVNVSGSAASVAITFTFAPATTYTVRFLEMGLPAGTSWSATLNGTTQTSSNSSIAFAETYGSYLYTMGSVSGYVPNPASGTVTISEWVNNVIVSFEVLAPGSYILSFTETGLPMATSWLVTLNGTTRSSTGTEILLTEPNGTYAYSGSAPGYTTQTGSLTVNGGSPAPVTVHFTPSSSSSLPAVDYVIIGVVVAVGVVGGIAALLSRRGKSPPKDSQTPPLQPGSVVPPEQP